MTGHYGLSKPYVVYHYEAPIDAGPLSRMGTPKRRGATIKPRTVKISAGISFMPPGMLYVLIEGQRIMRSGELGQRDGTIVFDETERNAGYAYAPPPWLAEIIAEVHAFEDRRMSFGAGPLTVLERYNGE